MNMWKIFQNFLLIIVVCTPITMKPVLLIDNLEHSRGKKVGQLEKIAKNRLIMQEAPNLHDTQIT